MHGSICVMLVIWRASIGRDKSKSKLLRRLCTYHSAGALQRLSHTSWLGSSMSSITISALWLPEWSSSNVRPASKIQLLDASLTKNHICDLHYMH